jgi:hypothetical protein
MSQNWAGGGQCWDFGLKILRFCKILRSKNDFSGLPKGEYRLKRNAGINVGGIEHFTDEGINGGRLRGELEAGFDMPRKFIAGSRRSQAWLCWKNRISFWILPINSVSSVPSSVSVWITSISLFHSNLGHWQPVHVSHSKDWPDSTGSRNSKWKGWMMAFDVYQRLHERCFQPLGAIGL